MGYFTDPLGYRRVSGRANFTHLDTETRTQDAQPGTLERRDYRARALVQGVSREVDFTDYASRVVRTCDVRRFLEAARTVRAANVTGHLT